MTYGEAVNQAMLRLAREPNAVFVGQGVASDGVASYADLDGVPADRRVEFPVAEELQLGCGIGLALQGYLPVLVYPRMDFLLRAADQLVNHLDKLEAMTGGAFRPKVVVKTRVGPKAPLDAGPQHTQNHSAAFRRLLTNVDVLEPKTPEEVYAAYVRALRSPRSTLVVEGA